MATFTTGLYSNSSFVSTFNSNSVYPGGLRAANRIEYDRAHIQNITITDTGTGTSSAYDFTNTNTSGPEGIPLVSGDNGDVLNSGAYTGGQTVETFVAADGTVYNDVPIVATTSYRVQLYANHAGTTAVDNFWVTSVFLDLDGDGVKDANEDDYFISTRDLSTIPESYRVDFQTTNSGTQNVISDAYVTAASTTVAGPVDGTESADNMQIGYTDTDGDIIDGADGNDDVIFGYGGDDTIVGGLGNDIIDGGDGNDLIDAGQTTDGGTVEQIFGGNGDDTVLGGWGADTVDGGDGIDTYSQTNRGSAVNIDLDAGTTTFAANSDVQTVTNFENATGGFGSDTITGSAADNILIGDGAAAATGNDTISGLGGNDTIFGGGGDDSLDGGTGNDAIDGGADNDTIDGGSGEDTILGGTGDDSIDGGTGNDTVDGGDGNDVISGGDCEMEWQAGGTPSYSELIATNSASNSISGSFVNSDGDTVNVTHSSTNSTYDSISRSPVSDAHNLGTAGETNTHSFDAPVSGVQLHFSAMVNTEKASFLFTFADGQVMTLSEAIAAGRVNVDTSQSNETVVGDELVGGPSSNPGGFFDSTFVNVTYPLTDVAVTSSGAVAGALPYEFFVDTSAPTLVEVPGSGDDSLLGGAGDDTINGECGDDTIDGGADNDVIDGGTGDDITTGGTGNDTFTGLSGNDTITDFNTGNTGAINDGVQTNNDFVDLSGFYNQANYDAAVTAGDIDPLVIKNPLQWMQADQADDGILNDTNAGWDANNTLTIQSGGSATASADLTFDNTNVVCFAAGTMIQTQMGEVSVENLRQGDMVLTRDRGFQPLRWVGGNKVSIEVLAEHANLRPIRIQAGALGSNLPQQDLLVSPQHRVLVSSKIVERMFNGEAEVLVAAKQLVMIDGIDVADDVDSVEYFHFLFDQHEIVFSNGAETESLFTGPEALKAVSPEARTEILTLFPELSDIDYAATACRTIVKGRKGRQLAVRHKNKNKPLLELN